MKSRPQALTPDQRAELGFPDEIIQRIEQAAGAEAAPFFETVLIPSANIKGKKGLERNRLAGFSVRTKRAEKIINDHSRPLRAGGYLIFRSEQNYGSVPDVLTVIRGNNSYDILKTQRTEAPHYNLDTPAIIKWLKARQKEGSFVITGAGADWVEARFIKSPKKMSAFAKKVYAFAPDVVTQSGINVEKLSARMKQMNGFYLVWD